MPDAAAPSPTTGTVRLLRLLLAASLIGPALFLGGAAKQERRVLLQEAARRAESSAEVLEQHAAAALRAYELIFARVEEHVRAAPDEGEAQRHAYLAAVEDELKETESLFVTDAAGRVAAHSRFYPVRPLLVADRDYFRDLAPRRTAATAVAGDVASVERDRSTPTLDARALSIGVPNVGRYSGTPKLNIARALTTADGRFAGIVAISVAQEYFEAFHRQLAASRADAMILARADGVLLARSPALDASSLRQVFDPASRRALLRRLTGGTTTRASTLDGVQRIVAYRKLAGYPVYVGYGLATATALGTWRTHVVAYGLSALLAALALFGVAWLALRAARDEARSRAGLVAEMGRRESAEAALRQAQKMEAVGQLTGGVAHDFNNLLTVIRSSTDLLKRPNLREDRRVRYVDAISDTVDRAAKLTGQLLAFARRQSLTPSVFDAGQSVRAIGEMMGTLTGSRVVIVLRLPDQACFLNADPSQFDTALVNMAVNARDAMDGEGRLTIRVQAVDELPATRDQLAVAGAFVAVSLSDTGCGIAPERQECIFEPFYTTKAVGQGTGLGLSQVFGFAKQSGGEIRVESELGRGTTFTLYLPRAAEAAGAAEDSEPEPLMDGHGTRVLIVEDNADVGAFTSQALTELGYSTSWAADAEAALTELAKNAERFDVVFSDVVMPGMSGIDLAKEIRSGYRDLPVVLTSGYSHVLAENGTSGFELLRKPYSIEQLSRVLRQSATRQRHRRMMAVKP